jgi:hypothetical protein
MFPDLPALVSIRHTEASIPTCCIKTQSVGFALRETVRARQIVSQPNKCHIFDIHHPGIFVPSWFARFSLFAKHSLEPGEVHQIHIAVAVTVNPGQHHPASTPAQALLIAHAPDEKQIRALSDRASTTYFLPATGVDRILPKMPLPVLQTRHAAKLPIRRLRGT